MGIHPVTACCVSADNIWLCSFDFHILLRGILSALNPLQRLRRCHIQIGFQQGFILFWCNPLCPQITWASAFHILIYCPIDPFGSCQTILGFINFSMRIDLLGTDTLCQCSGWCNGIFTTQGNKPHFKGGHFCSCPNAHCITCSGIKRRIPHLVTRKSRIIRLV